MARITARDRVSFSWDGCASVGALVLWTRPGGPSGPRTATQERSRKNDRSHGATNPQVAMHGVLGGHSSRRLSRGN